MKKNHFNLLTQIGSWSLIVCLLCLGCGKDVDQVEFTLNSRTIESSDVEPDTSKMINVFPGDTIYLRDASQPAKSVKKRAWYVDGELMENANNSKFFPIAIEESGIYKVTLAVNGQLPGVTKWINVEDANFFDDTNPTVTFQQPYDGQEFEGDERRVTIEAYVDNVFEKEELSLQVNGKDQKFTFDADNKLISARVRLSRGSNDILVAAETIEGSDSKNIAVSYSKGKSSYTPPPSPPPVTASAAPRNDPPPPPPPRPSPAAAAPIVKINSPTNNAKSGNARQELMIKTKNLSGREDLSIFVNGTQVQNHKYSTKRSAWIAEANLQGGKNVIEARVRNGGGSASDKVVVEYDAPAADLGELGTAGFDISKRVANCVAFSDSEYKFTITPKQDIELLSFYVATNVCGGIQITLDSGNDITKMRSTLVKGKNQIPLTDLYARLEPGTTYTLTVGTLTGYGRCEAEQKPKLEDATGCSVSPASQAHFNVDYKGKSIIYDLKYLY